MKDLKPADGNAAEQQPVDVAALKAEAHAAGKKEGVVEGAKAERARITAIFNLEEAKGRTNLARTIALETDTAPEQAQKLLAAAPVETKNNALAGAMAGVKNPNVGADAGDGDSADGEVRKILAVSGHIKEGK